MAKVLDFAGHMRHLWRLPAPVSVAGKQPDNAQQMGMAGSGQPAGVSAPLW